MSQNSDYQSQGDPSIPGKFESLWIDTTPDTNFPELSQNIEVDVVIVGGGIVGLTTALFLKEAGLKIAVIEARKIVKGVTGHTTAKVTSQHSLIYDYLISTFGKEKAKFYGNSNEEAITRIESVSKKYRIDCDFKRLPAYVFAENSEDSGKVKKEVEAAKNLGLPASFEENFSSKGRPSSGWDFPLESYGAIKFDNQAQFHPRKYLLGVAEQIPDEDNFIFENTTVLSFKEGEPCTVITDKGVVKAKDVVIATHVPFFKSPGAFFTRLYQIRSYVYGLYIKGKLPEGVFYGTLSHTIRSQPTKKGTIILMGNEDHKAGQGGDIVARYKRIVEYYKKFFEIEEIDYHWSTQDPDTPDRVPFIGKISSNSKHVFMASGFAGWGMTNGTVAAMLISDLILGKDNPWKELYDPGRVTIEASTFGRFISENANVAEKFIGGKIAELEEIDVSKVTPGEGLVGKLNGQKVGAFKDNEGRVYGVKLNCTFEGCDLAWNNAEKTWDCPCCGSRFFFDGKVMQGPATKDLQGIEI